MVDLVVLATMLPDAWEDDQELHRRHLLRLRTAYRAGRPRKLVTTVFFPATVNDRRRRSGRTRASPSSVKSGRPLRS